MNWQNADMFSDEGKDINMQDFQIKNDDFTHEEAKEIQLKKYIDPSKNVERQAIITVMNKFGDLLVNDKLQDLANSLLAEESEAFLFSSTGREPVEYAPGPEAFVELYQTRKVIERRIRQTYVDVEKKTGIQICNYKVIYDDNSESEEYAFEVFTIKESRIVKYRASFAKLAPAYEGQDPLEFSRKERILAKVKEINYSLAGRPDLEKVASYLNDATEYKIWSWNGQKCFTLKKKDFVENFKKLEENLGIECVVPYEVFTDSTHAVGTYVYHLVDKSNQARKFLWLSTCAYIFDGNLNIMKISQQGELHLKEEASVPFEVYSRERVIEKARQIFSNFKGNFDLLYNDSVEFGCEICRFCPAAVPNLGKQGVKNIDPLFLAALARIIGIEWIKIIDVFVDQNDPSYDSVIMLICSQGKINVESYVHKGKQMNFISMTKFSLENGKLSRLLDFLSEIPEAIPSPFDDQNFEACNIHPLK